MIYIALYLLERFKSRHQELQGLCGHSLFLAAMILAAKTHLEYGHTLLRNAYWASIQPLFPLKQINELEHWMLNMLDHYVWVNPEELMDFRKRFEDIIGLGAVSFGPPLPAVPTNDDPLFLPFPPEPSDNNPPSSPDHLPTIDPFAEFMDVA